MKTILKIIAIWGFFGWINFGATMANFSKQFPRTTIGGYKFYGVVEPLDGFQTWRKNLGISAFMGVGGPVSILPVMFTTNIFEYGFALTPSGVAELIGAEQ